MDTDITQTDTAEKLPLTAHDRCDACGSQAYIKVFIHDTELLFCGHHFNKNSEHLTKNASHVQNEYYKLQKDSPKNQVSDEELE